MTTPLSSVRASAVTGLVVVIGYLALLGWDQHKTLGSDGYQHGPYQAWQVLGMIALLALLAGWAGRRDAVVAATAAATITLTLLFAVDAATDADSDGLWPIGALMVAVATFGGFTLVAMAGKQLNWSRRLSD